MEIEKHLQHRWNSTIRCLIIFLLLMLCALKMSVPVTAQESPQEEQKVIRVAYVQAAGYQEGGDGEYKTGFGYEYLQKIKSYTGWEYEYVYGSFSELLEGVANGEI